MLGRCIERTDILNELIPQAAFEQGGAQRGGAHGHQFLTGIWIHRQDHKA